MQKILFVIFILVRLNGFGQDLECEDFKEGIFKLEVLQVLGLENFEWEIIRKGNEQTEKLKKIPDQYKDSGYTTNPTSYVKIEWINNCSYRAKYDESKSELNERQKFINSVGGITTEMIRIEENCFFYKSTLKVDDKEQVMTGKICK